MDCNDNKVTATFFNHYSAMLLKKKLGDCALLRPVPRSLSSSCGTCCVVEGRSADEILSVSDENLEAIYENTGSGYRKIYERD